MAHALRLNQGDPSEARVYYCAHFVALALDLFREEGTDVVLVSTSSGGHTVRGGQIPAVISGDADLTIGGPMVTMKNYEENGPALVSFCACVRGNPWFLASATAKATGFGISDIGTARVIDIGNVGTATMSFRWLLDKLGLRNVTLIPGGGNEEEDIAAIEQGKADYAFHSLHALAPYVSAGRLPWTFSLAGVTGPIPWSAYIARPERMKDEPLAYAAFVRAIAKALVYIGRAPIDELARLIAPFYPGMDRSALICALDGYRSAGVFATDAMISRRDFDRFAAILKAMGWLRSSVPYDSLVEPGLWLSRDDPATANLANGS